MANDMYAVIRSPKNGFAFGDIVWRPKGGPDAKDSVELFIPYNCFTNSGDRYLSEHDVRDRFLRISGVVDSGMQGKPPRVTRATLMPRVFADALTLRGQGKAINEDFLLHFADAHRQYAFVADGVGGNPGGELAAEYVCSRLFRLLKHDYHERRGSGENLVHNGSLADDYPETAAQSLLTQILDADSALRTESASWSGKQNAMCVFAALAIIDYRIWAFRVGDPGIFGVAPDGTLKPILPLPTDLNEKRVSAAMGQSNVLLNVEAQEIPNAISDWQGFLLCTDGVYRDPAAFDALNASVGPHADATVWVSTLQKRLTELRRRDDSTIVAFSLST